MRELRCLLGTHWYPCVLLHPNRDDAISQLSLLLGQCLTENTWNAYSDIYKKWYFPFKKHEALYDKYLQIPNVFQKYFHNSKLYTYLYFNTHTEMLCSNITLHFQYNKVLHTGSKVTERDLSIYLFLYRQNKETSKQLVNRFTDESIFS